MVERIDGKGSNMFFVEIGGEDERKSVKRDVWR